MADFKPEQNDYENLTPFKNWLVNQINTWGINNFPFLENDFDQLTNYGMLMKMMKCLNDVIANENKVEEDMTNIFQAFTELQAYVNNYFDNLDVQEEINNKLDEMTESGTLDEIISRYIDPYLTQFNDRLNVQDNRINAIVSSTPIPVSSTSQMTDTTKIYVNTTDGKWYYYDGDSWEVGGTYQSTGLGLNEVKFENLIDNLQNNISRIPTYTTNSGYINVNGTISSNSAYFYTSPIYIRKDEVIEFDTNVLTTMSPISTVSENNANNTRQNQVEIITAGVNHIKWKALQNCYVVLTSKNDELKNLRIYTDEEDTGITNENFKLMNKDFITTPEYTLTNGRYVNNNLGFSNQGAYSTSSPIRLKKNETISFTCAFASTVCCIAKCDENENLISILVNDTESDGKIHGVSYTANEDMYVMISCMTVTLLDVRIIKNLAKTFEDLNIEEYKYSDILSMFSNITCIGDSLTYSQVYISDTSPTSRQAYVTYPMNLEKKTGTPTTNLAYSGDTATQAWERWGSDIVQKTNQLTIIYLGTNYGLTDTMDTDVVGDDYNNYADTNTGNYAKLVKKSLDVGSKVILVKIYANVAHRETTNSVIEQMAERFNVAFVENERLTNPVYHYYPDKSGINTLHYNDLGYVAFTEQLISNVANLSDNMKERIYPV